MLKPGDRCNRTGCKRDPVCWSQVLVVTELIVAEPSVLKLGARCNQSLCKWNQVYHMTYIFWSAAAPRNVPSWKPLWKTRSSWWPKGTATKRSLLENIKQEKLTLQRVQKVCAIIVLYFSGTKELAFWGHALWIVFLCNHMELHDNFWHIFNSYFCSYELICERIPIFLYFAQTALPVYFVFIGRLVLKFLRFSMPGVIV